LLFVFARSQIQTTRSDPTKPYRSSPGEDWTFNIGRKGDWAVDTAYAYVGADFSDLLDTWSEKSARRILEAFAAGKIQLSDLLGPKLFQVSSENPWDDIYQFREAARKRMERLSK